MPVNLDLPGTDRVEYEQARDAVVGVGLKLELAFARLGGHADTGGAAAVHLVWSWQRCGHA